MKIRINNLPALCALLFLTVTTLLGSVGRGACQIPASSGTLAFVRLEYNFGPFQIYSMSANGKNLKRLTQTMSDEFYPSWSPEGSRILFVSNNRTSPTSTLSMMLADGTQRTTLATLPGQINHPAWSPDGRWIVFGGDAGLYLLDMNAKKRVPVLFYSGGSAGLACMPSWRRDSWCIAFMYKDNNSRRDDIFSINVDGSGLTNLTNTPYEDEGNPAWSPNSNTIAYVRGGYPSSPPFAERSGEIYLMDPDGSNRRQATFTGGQCWGAPTWSPDGEMIAYSALIGNEFKLYATVPSDGYAIQLTFGAYQDFHPMWKR